MKLKHGFILLTTNVPKLQLGEWIQKVKMDSDATNVRMLLHTPNEDVGSENKQIYQNTAWHVRHMPRLTLRYNTHPIFSLACALEST